ncbi:3-hydroxyacyl-CoA dehydrogenase [Novosphingobium sp. G106]|uniref:3-hydroxyacyl-CoA dehydrogenase n=1 Tax=Novosphingobium sp. G106 TaxID=2849500 RepID=UPI001C2D0A1F|nr:3-hydroxyacyl-CoA dehydrogenase [Novosphingobium sp. G106]MBV1686255.1 3-hydroxyacyl-CoA dehydrogenase [Novosphingobium sp. G106]
MKALIAGAGVVGSEIGFQCAYGGLEVAMFDISEKSLDTSRASHAAFAELFQKDGRLTDVEADALLARISYETDIAIAANDADIVSESVTETWEVKAATYRALSDHCPPKTIFTTNTSTMLPSELAKFTDRPNRFLACHVGRPVWEAKLLEIMPHEGTDPELLDEIRVFSRRIGLIPIVLLKEQVGYVSNSIIAPFVIAGLDLVMRGVATYDDVDRLWMFGTKSTYGPIAMVDLMGIQTVYNGLKNLSDTAGKTEFLPIMQYLKEEFIDKGKLGIQSGEGFYTYPGPAYGRADFIG